jgi:hypothetical protein
MQHLKFVLVVALVFFSGSCAAWFPKTTYYYMVSSGCTANGLVTFTMPSGSYTNSNNPLHSYTTKAYKFKSGQGVFIGASITFNSARCNTKPITVTIMKGESPEGSIGTGGSVWKTATRAGSVSVEGTAD